MSCVYFQECPGQNVHGCRINERCRLTGGTSDCPSCDQCTSRLLYTDKHFTSKWIDPLEVVDVRKNRTDCLRKLLGGRSAFLVCGGPSANEQLPLLNQRGVFSLAVNNVAGNKVRPQAFVCSDPPMKFSHSIWMDPGIMKFIPIPKMSGRRAFLREKHNGVFSKSKTHVTGSPNVWGFQRVGWMEPGDDSFFTSSGACWGNLDEGVTKTGQPKTVCTMLLGIRLLAYLGASRIFMVGVDFVMRSEQGYSFDQGRTVGATGNNNSQYAIVNNWLCQMQNQGLFKKFGVTLFNCYQNSGLRAFPYVPFEIALKDVIGKVEQQPDLSHWYNKSACSECRSWNIRVDGINNQCMNCNNTWRTV